MITNIYAACRLSIIPMRAEAAHRSEMVSQLLFLEHFEILEAAAGWVRIRTTSDQYEGWIQEGQFSRVTQEAYSAWLQLPKALVGLDTTLSKATLGTTQIDLQHGTFIPLSLGSWKLGDAEYHFHASLHVPVKEDFAQDIVAVAKSYHLSPYLWGGRSRTGIDCSGFSQVVYRHFGYYLPRDAYQQAAAGDTVDFISMIQAGDLAFFDNENGKITHVGIMLDQEHIIHASASVRIDRMDATGIYNEELQKYSHKLRIIKRYTNVS
ncbi:C40 family peptidase [Rhinopithecimicrobium faecis]